jgi:lipid A 4'-phosphatase
LVVLLSFTAVFRVTDLDLAFSALFYSPTEGWKYFSWTFCRLAYNNGALPALGLTILTGITVLGSLVRNSLAAYRSRAMFIVMLMALGPGLMVNLMKNNTGRPRPMEIADFGGTREFLKPLSLGEPGNGESFPSGHASMGFFLEAPYFILRRSRPATARAWLALGIASGLAIGVARMAQGGHFASDVLWSWGTVHLSALILSHMLNLERPRFRQLPLPE